MRLYDNIAQAALASEVMYAYYLLKLDRTVYFLSFHATDGVAMVSTKISTLTGEAVAGPKVVVQTSG